MRLDLNDRRKEARQECNRDASIKGLVRKSPMQIRQHINQNVTDLATAKQYLARAFVLLAALSNQIIEENDDE